MKKSLSVLSLLMFLSVGILFGQTTKSTPFSAKVNFSQKHGISIIKGEFVLVVEYDADNVKYKTRAESSMSSFSLSKKTDKYVIGVNGGNYCFYDIVKEQFYYIDYFMSRYLLSGSGKGYSEVKQTVINMMDMLNDGKTQKDVISHLIKQTEYDF